MGAMASAQPCNAWAFLLSYGAQQDIYRNFKAAVVSGISEATATLVNFNLDFSLFKSNHPRYSPLWELRIINPSESAESGVVHPTARKLGALFDPLLPDTPRLIKAYGSRASEIVLKSKIENKNTIFGSLRVRWA
ncbi:hypothetical protein BDW66DRAFT_147797 [Aspergillus desertorum]